MYLRKSQCDYVDEYPWVCCLKVQMTTRRPRTSKTTKRLITSDSHPSTLFSPGDSLCGQPFRNLDNRIYGGSKTYIGEFPW